MIKHIVFFGLTETFEGKNKAEIASFIKSELESLKNLIPQIKKIEVGVNHVDAAVTNHDLVLYSEFENMNDLELYVKHPEHQKVAAFIGKVKTSRAAVDYEV